MHVKDVAGVRVLLLFEFFMFLFSSCAGFLIPSALR